ncbi:hypothetical protein [Sphingomonas radiodurans]|uniref:hypothetical protein n=1 Tax=Sphingomonas radiodurans TaxID=2890321 RepID=UPI001E4FD259|nr:hypothetical protein [Sphingomonas radiodurans]WBH16316.1 hypothetical protein LLW23_16195 [Sphingomonas radiodurans]
MLTLEGRPDGATDDPAVETARVFDRLRIALARFAGPDGFASLVRRALALARAEHPSLRQVSMAADGSFEGLEQGSDDAVLAVIAQFLGLLVTFVGEPLTLRLVRDAWPEASVVDDIRDTRPIA